MTTNPETATHQTILKELAQIRATMEHLSELVLDHVGNNFAFKDAENLDLKATFRKNVNATALNLYQLYTREPGGEGRPKQPKPRGQKQP